MLHGTDTVSVAGSPKASGEAPAAQPISSVEDFQGVVAQLVPDAATGRSTLGASGLDFTTAPEANPTWGVPVAVDVYSRSATNFDPRSLCPTRDQAQKSCTIQTATVTDGTLLTIKQVSGSSVRNQFWYLERTDGLVVPLYADGASPKLTQQVAEGVVTSPNWQVDQGWLTRQMEAKVADLQATQHPTPTPSSSR